MAKRQSLFAVLLAVLLVLSGCGSSVAPNEWDPSGGVSTLPEASGGSSGQSGNTVMEDPSELFTDRDYETEYSGSGSAHIQLDGSSASCASNAVHIEGSTVTITDEGTYVISGTLDDGMIVVDADKEEKVHLVLSGAAIHSETSAPIYFLRADKVFITLEEGTVSTLSNGGSFVAVDENNIDSVIFSKEDLTLNGSGTLVISSPAGHGIVSKDELTVAGGVYEIVAASHGVTGKDNVCIDNAVMNITAGKDGIQADHDDDAALGFMHIESGAFAISAEGDGLSASSYLCINGGTFDILTGGGSANAQQSSSGAWGSFMPGGQGGMGPGGPGGMGPGDRGQGGAGGNGGSGGFPDIEEEDSTSIKGIKASGDLVINGGVFAIDSADDAVHSNSSLTVSGGTFDIATGDDGFHADSALTVAGGIIHITESYEGLEGQTIDLYGGDITLVASDDGLNAAGGTDGSGMGGFRGGDMFAADSSCYINIAGGTLNIQASGDGVDSNGTLTISGGFVTICGPISGDTAVLDFASTGTITGGTFIGTGAYAMAQTFSSSEGQGVIALSVGSQPAGMKITLTDEAGNVVMTHEPELPFAIVILSSPDIAKGASYTVTVGTASGNFEAT